MRGRMSSTGWKWRRAWAMLAPAIVVLLLAGSAFAAPVAQGPGIDAVLGARTREILTVPFSVGTGGVQTTNEYSGLTTVGVMGTGQASGSAWSDAFYIFTDYEGNPITPFHPTEYYNWVLWINGGPADALVNPIPAYNPKHVYVFTINAPGGPLTFAVGDAGTDDNSGQYQVGVLAGGR